MMTKSKLLLSLLIVLSLIAFIISVYAPSLIYFSQLEYFDHNFLDLVSRNFLLGLAASLLLAALFVILPKAVLKYVVALTFVFAVLLYLQADLFTISYGVLDGSAIDFDQHEQRGTSEMVVVVVVLALALLFSKWLAANAMFISVMVFLALFASVALRVFQAPDKPLQLTAYDPEIYRYSTQKNVIVIVLDGFGSEYFQQIYEADNSVVQGYDGFVGYSDAMSNYAATIGSLASMLTGEMLPENVKYMTHLKTDVKTKGLTAKFGERGYEVSLVSSNNKFRSVYPERFMSSPQMNQEQITRHSALKLLDMALFRSSPHQFKPDVYNHGQWLFSQTGSPGGGYANTFPGRGYVILDDTAKQSVTADQLPRFKVIHATIPHPEYIFDAECGHVDPKAKGANQVKMIAQSKCTLLLLNRLLEKYKAMGVYDQSLIVVTSDHGARILNTEQLTLSGFPSSFEMSASGIFFMIKGINQNGPYRQVDQPFSLLKLYDALMDEDLHTSDYSQLQDDDRLFHAYRPIHLAQKGYLPAGVLYRVNPDVENPKSWELAKFVTNGCEAQSLPIEVSFAQNNRSGYCGAFWLSDPNSRNNGMWTKGDDNRILFGVDHSSVNGAVLMSVTFKPKLFKGHDLDVVFSLNGNDVYSGMIAEKGEQVLQIGVASEYFVEGQNELQIRLPNVKSGYELGVGNAKMRRGLLLKSIEIKLAEGNH